MPQYKIILTIRKNKQKLNDVCVNERENNGANFVYKKFDRITRENNTNEMKCIPRFIQQDRSLACNTPTYRTNDIIVEET